jgi:hypothetical protein
LACHGFKLRFPSIHPELRKRKKLAQLIGYNTRHLKTARDSEQQAR